MSKKNLNAAGLLNELKGNSSFFPVRQLEPIKQTQPSPVKERAATPPQAKNEPPAPDTVIPRYQGVKIPSNHDTTIPFSEADMVEAVRKAVKQIGKEPATQRLTLEEKNALRAIEFTYAQQGIMTSGNEIIRIGMNFILKDYQKNGLKLSDISKIPTEYLDALTVEGDHLKLNTELIKQKQLATVNDSLESIKAAAQHGQATAQEVAVIQGVYNQLLAESQRTFGAFHQNAEQYDALLWQIANDAESAGYKFKDMAGKALTSAQSIYDYMSKGDAEFNNFVVQAANATGKSVAEIMNMIQGMIAQTIAAVHSVSLSAGSQIHSDAVMEGGTPAGTVKPVGSYTPIFTSGGEGSGLDTASDKAQKAADKKAKAKAEAERKAAEAAAKLQKEIDNARKAATSSLQDQLKSYKDIIDARKKILQTLVDERKYQQDIQDKNANILKLQNQLAQLSLDNSSEAQAQKLQVQDELKKAQQDLTNTQQDHSTKVQQDALDASYAAYEVKVNLAIKQIEGITASSTADFASQLAAILGKMSAPDIKNSKSGGSTTGNSLPTRRYHEGGIVGDSTPIKSNEVLAKLLKGEGVYTPEQAQNFVKNIIPNITQGINKGNGDINVSMPISVNGSLDSKVIPDLNRMVNETVKKLNDNLRQVGYVRRADAFSI